MNDILPYLPVLGYFAFATIMFAFRKFIFGLHASVLAIALAANLYLNLSNDGNIFIALAQIAFAVIAFILMVPFFAGKASGETMLAFSALIGLPPLARFFESSLVGFLLSLGLFVAFAVYANRGRLNEIKTMVNDIQNPDTPEKVSDTKEPADADVSEDTPAAAKAPLADHGGSVKDMLTVGALSTYNGQFKLPDYSYLPDASTVKKEERTSFSIFALSGYTIVVLFNLVTTVFFLDS